MSFILDALKKSETERQRGDAPALYEAKMAPARRGVAPWLIVLAALLVINIVVLTVVLLRGNHAAAPVPDTAAPTAAVAPAVAPTPAPPVPAAAPSLATAPPAQPPATVAAPAPDAAPSVQPQPAGAAADAASTGADTVVGGPGTAGVARPSDDDAPAVEPPRSARFGGGNGSAVQPTGGSSGELPTYQQAATAAGANLPDLTLNLHAYATNPADRFIFLNMIRLTEGQTSPQGVRVEAITPDGAILSWQGSRFLLQRQ